MKTETRNKLKELIAFAKSHHLMEMSWQKNGIKIAFRRNPNSSANSTAKNEPIVAQTPVSGNGHAEKPAALNEVVVKAPMVGTFRRSNSKDRPPLVVEGNTVKPGDRLGVVECMRIPNEVLSFCAGKIIKILVQDGQPVEYGQPLFSLSSTPVAEEDGVEATA